MAFDIPTLMGAGALMTCAASVLLVMAWLADRDARMLLWWSVAYLATGIGIGLLLVAGHTTWGAHVGSALIPFGAAMVWTAIRIFHGLRPVLPAIIAGTAGFFATGMPPLSHVPDVQVAAGLCLTALFFGAAIVALLRPSAARLRSRWPLVGFLAIHATVFAIGAVDAFSHILASNGFILSRSWFGVIHFEQLIFALASSIFVVNMVREASEQRHKTAAGVDMLTGVASRRAFFESAAAALRVAQDGDTPFSLAIFDLDRFKSVNDTFGHAAGDQVLQLFGHTAAARARPGDVVGRLGGEEFAIAMPGLSPQAAHVFAERIRQAFAIAGYRHDGVAVATMVSGGVAGAGPFTTLDELIEEADRALYRAKAGGRDRIELSRRPERPGASATIIRVA